MNSNDDSLLCCDICLFSTKNKYYFKKHLLTTKHVNLQHFPEKYIESCKKCNKKFKTRNGMILHLLKCKSPIIIKTPEFSSSSLFPEKGKFSEFVEKSLILKKEFSTIFDNINKNIELYNNIKETQKNKIKSSIHSTTFYSG